MIARVTTFAVEGVEAKRVWVEADIRIGLPAFTVAASRTRRCARRASASARR